MLAAVLGVLVFPVLANLTFGAIDMDTLKKEGPLWERTRRPPASKRHFELLSLCGSATGVVTTRELWETEGYEKTYATLLEGADSHIRTLMARHLDKTWLPSKNTGQESLVLVAARLQEPMGPKRDRVYLSYEKNGRNVLVTLLGGDHPILGLTVELQSKEMELARKRASTSDFEERMDNLLHSILKADPYAPYRIRVRMTDDTIELRGEYSGSKESHIKETDRQPLHYRSTLAGTVRGESLIVCWDAQKFYYDCDSGDFVVTCPPASIIEPNTYFECLIGR